jgi:protein tyrosine phosphatase (PTP) superfamily phosphohydrolase (DUF442 family)
MFLAVLLLSGRAVLSAGTRPLRTSTAEDSSTLLIASKTVVEGIRNFGEVTPTLYRGAQPKSEGLRKLQEMKFDIIVDFRPNHDSERKIVTSLGMEYVAIPWRCNDPEDKDIADFITLVRAHPGKKIFVHCLDGIDRTGMEIAAFRIIEQGWSAAEARKEMVAFGFSRYHRTICMPTVHYEANFLSRFQNSPAFQALRSQSSIPGHPQTNN